MNYELSSASASWFKDQYTNQALTLKPPYQRKPVWQARQKCYLMESILLGYPIPEIYVQRATTPRGETKYAIVDGQQRIRTLLQFVGADTEEPAANNFALDKLGSESPWLSQRFEDLEDAEKVKIFDYQFAVRYLITNSDDEVKDVFRRLNKYLAPLKPQELRNATYAGPFIVLAAKLADDEYWFENKIITAAAIRRMGDVEFMSELLMGLLHGPQGGDRDTIDEYYGTLEDYDEFPGQRQVQRQFAQSKALLEVLFPELPSTRWSNKTDFYSLFVALGAGLQKGTVKPGRVAGLRRALRQFAEAVDEYLTSKRGPVDSAVRRYVLAVEKGANDKMRRVQRHEALLGLIQPFLSGK